MVLIIRDVTKDYRMQETLRESEERYRLLFENAPLCIHELDLEGRFTSMNRAGLKMMGVENESDICGQAYLDVVADEDRERIGTLLDRAREGEPSVFQFKVEGENGPLFFDSSFIPLKDHNGDVVKLMGVSDDITERKRAEEALRAGEARFRDLAEMLPEVVFEVNKKLNVTYANKKALDLFRYSGEDIALGLNCFDMIVPEDRQRAHDNVLKRARGEAVGPVEYEALRKDRSTFPVFLHMSPIERDGEIAGFRGLVVDITERKRLEEEARRAHNLESLGVLAGGIAHDFNNVLAGVAGNLELLVRLLDKDSEEYEIANDGRQAALRAKGLTQQLMTFAHGGAPVREIASIEALVRETTEQSLRGPQRGRYFALPMIYPMCTWTAVKSAK